MTDSKRSVLTSPFAALLGTSPKPPATWPTSATLAVDHLGVREHRISSKPLGKSVVDDITYVTLRSKLDYARFLVRAAGEDPVKLAIALEKKAKAQAAWDVRRAELTALGFRTYSKTVN